MPVTSTNTKTLPQLPLVAVLNELFENGADRWRSVRLGRFRPLARWRDISDEMRPGDEQRSRLLRLRSIDAEFAHTVVESGAVQSEASGWSRWAANHPTRFAEYAKNVVAFNGFERC